MASRQVIDLTSEMGALEITRGGKAVSVTVYTGMARVTLASGMFRTATMDLQPVGPFPLTGTLTEDGVTYDITDPRTVQERARS